jgi:hypothetical protein
MGKGRSDFDPRADLESSLYSRIMLKSNQHRFPNNMSSQYFQKPPLVQNIIESVKWPEPCLMIINLNPQFPSNFPALRAHRWT